MEFFIGLVLGAVVGLITMRPTAGIVAGLFGVVATWLFLPVLAVNFVDLWFIVLTGLAIGFAISIMADSSRGMRSSALTLGVVAILFVVGAFFTTSSVFHAKAYADLLGKVETKPFVEAVQRLNATGEQVPNGTVLDQSHVRLVDAAIALRRAQELLGHDPQFGGTYVLGEPHLTRRDEHLVWSIPLEFNGFFKWLWSDGTPGYVWVDAHDYQQARLVTEVEGKSLHMRCMESAYFGQDLDRLIWRRHPTIGIADYTLEIGPNDHPYYVATAYEHAVGFSGANPTGVVIVDPTTCDMQSYDMEHLPPWVNREVPEGMAWTQADDWGTLSGGWLNGSGFGSHQGVKRMASEIALVSTSDHGDTAWYIGVSTAGNPNGTTGFLLIDSRTKKATYFEQTGATEEAARGAIQGKVAQMQGWTVSLPILYNIGDRATYLAVIKDASGNAKQIGLMPVDDRNLVVVDDNLQTALLVYLQQIATHPSGEALPSGLAVTVDARVVRVGTEVQNGQSIFYFVLEGRPETFATVNRLGAQVSLTHTNDQVHIVARGAPGSPLIISEFVNRSLTP